MRYGHFDDARKEYVITSPRTPLPWINYLGNKDFFSLISNTAGGYSFYKDAKLRRITRYRYNGCPLDQGGRYYYINDKGTVWNPGWQPVQSELDNYSCRHGLGYSIIKGEKNGLSCELTAFVPLNSTCEINRLIFRNESEIEKNFDLYSLVEWCLWDAQDDASNFQRNFSTGEVEIEGSTIYHKTEYRERRNHFAFYNVNAKICGFDTQRSDFMGLYNGFSHPDAVFENKSRNSIAHGWQPVGSHHLKLSLKPNETKSLIFMIGYCENSSDNKFVGPNIINKAPARELIEKYSNDEKVDKALLELKNYWNRLLMRFQVDSSDEKFNRVFNIWNQYQCMVTFNMSRSASYFESGLGRGMGFRDSCQDLLGFVHMIPERARERIIDIASIQFEDGSTYHQYQPLTKKGNAQIGGGFNDDPLWLIACVCAYIKETGDFSILDEDVPFNSDKNNSATLLDHLFRSFNFTTTHLGPHGLPLIGRADWNDCLNLNCFSSFPGESFQTFGPSEGPVAESIFIAGMYVLYGKEFAHLLSAISRDKDSKDIRAHVSRMNDTIEKYGWDGEYFLRAYDANGDPVGSKVCEEGQIYIEPQGMCVMGGVGLLNGHAEKALKSVEDRLDSKYGISILEPAYTRYHLELGEISSYPPGYKENAGIFCHNNPWIGCAETLLGHGNRAFEVFKKTCPVYLEDISDIHKTEPYAYCQMVAGKDSSSFGEGKNSWLTGTAAWTFTCISQYILGIKPEYDGLRIAPCIPSDVEHIHVDRLFRNINFHIDIDNHSHNECGISKVLLNGNEYKDNLIRLNDINGGMNDIDVTVIIG